MCPNKLGIENMRTEFDTWVKAQTFFFVFKDFLVVYKQCERKGFSELFFLSSIILY